MKRVFLSAGVSRTKGRWQYAKVRKQLFEETGGRCAYCGTDLEDIWAMTVDHILPKSAGGRDENDNLLACCKKCNSSKGSRSVEYLREQIACVRNNRPRFSPEQTAWLARAGFVPPVEPAIRFLFEDLGLPKKVVDPLMPSRVGHVLHTLVRHFHHGTAVPGGAGAGELFGSASRSDAA